MDLGRAIKLCRTQRNLTQEQLANRIGISKSYLSLIERGRRDPNFSTIKEIASALEVPVSILVFLATDGEELESISPELAAKLSHTTLKLIEASNEEATLH